MLLHSAISTREDSLTTEVTSDENNSSHLLHHNAQGDAHRDNERDHIITSLYDVSPMLSYMHTSSILGTIMRILWMRKSEEVGGIRYIQEEE